MKGEGVKIEALKTTGVNCIIMVIYIHFFIIKYFYLFETFSKFLGMYYLLVY